MKRRLALIIARPMRVMNGLNAVAEPVFGGDEYVVSSYALLPVGKDI